MNNREVRELLEMAKKLRWSHALVAQYLDISEGYWSKIRHEHSPVTEDVLKEIRKLNKKLKAFAAA